MQVLRRDELDQYNSYHVHENRCFICKRTEAEIQDFLIEQLYSITEKYDLELEDMKLKLQNKKDSLKSHLDGILNFCINTGLDLKMDLAVLGTDPRTKNIPQIYNLIDMRKEFSNSVTLSDIITRILELRNELENDQVYEENRKINLENNVGKNSVWYSDSGYFRHVASFYDENKIQIGNLEIEEILDSMEKLEEEREIHLKSLEPQIDLIKKSKHKKISRGTIDLPKVTNTDDVESYKISIMLPVCVICHSMGWHESSNHF